MLDVARHFFGPADVKRYIDLIALYKMNRLHLHLTDDQVEGGQQHDQILERVSGDLIGCTGHSDRTHG